MFPPTQVGDRIRGRKNVKFYGFATSWGILIRSYGVLIRGSRARGGAGAGVRRGLPLGGGVDRPAPPRPAAGRIGAATMPIVDYVPFNLRQFRRALLRGAPRRHCRGHGAGAEHLSLDSLLGLRRARAVGHQPDGRPSAAARPLRLLRRGLCEHRLGLLLPLCAASLDLRRRQAHARRDHVPVVAPQPAPDPDNRQAHSKALEAPGVGLRRHPPRTRALFARDGGGGGGGTGHPRGRRAVRAWCLRQVDSLPQGQRAEPRRRPPVGGIGLRIRDELLLHTTSWLHAVDDAACTYFAEVLPDGDSGDEALANIIEHFAGHIADRIARCRRQSGRGRGRRRRTWPHRQVLRAHRARVHDTGPVDAVQARNATSRPSTCPY